MNVRLLVISLAGLIVGGAPSSAHHSFSAEFDENAPIKLVGTVTKFDLVNPHVWVYIDVKGADGKVVNWAIEGRLQLSNTRQ